MSIISLMHAELQKLDGLSAIHFAEHVEKVPGYSEQVSAYSYQDQTLWLKDYWMDQLLNARPARSHLSRLSPHMKHHDAVNVIIDALYKTDDPSNWPDRSVALP